jgi:predicted nucleic acid-binding protein
MIIDASVWVAIFRENDFHHDASVAFLDWLSRISKI